MLPIGFVVLLWNDLLDCEQENTETEILPVWEGDYVDAILDNIRQGCDPTWEAHATIMWADGLAAHVGYLDKPFAGC